MYGTGKLEVGCWTCDGGEFASANGASDLEASCGGEIGSERHPSSCGSVSSLPLQQPGYWTGSLRLLFLLVCVGGVPAMAVPAAAAWVEMLATAGCLLLGRLDRR